jgi:hypothetical protein
VIVLDGGQIREFDDPRRLMEDRNSHFYSMLRGAGIVSSGGGGRMTPSRGNANI